MKNPEQIISDDMIEQVHGYANFGPVSKRDVVAEGVLKYAFGYTSGHTQLMIILEHGLVRNPRPGRYETTLTNKGMAYLRAVFGSRFNEIFKIIEADAMIAARDEVTP